MMRPARSVSIRTVLVSILLISALFAEMLFPAGALTDDVTPPSRTEETVSVPAFLGSGDIPSRTLSNNQAEAEGFTFEKASGKTVRICGYTGRAEELVFPSSIGGKSVSEICSLGENDTVRSVSIPGTVKSIEEWAFTHFSVLETVRIGEGTETIGDRSFYSCTSLLDVLLPGSVKTISQNAFQDCGSLRSVTFGKNNAVYRCVGECVVERETGTVVLGFGNCTIPDDGSIKRIGPMAFSGRKITKAVIPSGITEIGNGAYDFCSFLREVSLPQGLTTLSYGAFSFCRRLRAVKLPDSLKTIKNGAFSNCLSLKRIEIPDSVTQLDGYVFRGCSVLEDAVIGNGVAALGDSLFENCERLRRVILGPKVKKIGVKAFSGCGVLAVEISSVRQWLDMELDSSTFPYGRALCLFVKGQPVTELEIPEGMKEIGPYTCRGLQLSRLILPSTLVSLSDYEFFQTSVTEIVNRSKLSISFGSSDYNLLLRDCVILTDRNGKQTYRDGYRKSGDYVVTETDGQLVLAAYTGSKQTLVLPETVEGRSYVMTGFGSSVDVVFPSSFEEIPRSFLENSKIRSAALPSSVKTIGYYAFKNSLILGKVTLGAGLTWISDQSFYECRNLWTIVNNSLIELFPGRFNNGYAAAYADEVIQYGRTDLRTFTSLWEARDLLLDGIEGNDALSDFEKALLIHDRLANWCEYKNPVAGGQTVETALVDRWTVCAGYAEAFDYLATEVGLTNCQWTGLAPIESHAWNAINLHDVWYFIDVTWDSTWTPGCVKHRYFLGSRKDFEEGMHYPFSSEDPTDERYDHAWWRNVDSPFVLFDGKIYCIYERKLCELRNESAVPVGLDMVVDAIAAGCEGLFLRSDNTVYLYAEGREPEAVFSEERDGWFVSGIDFEDGWLIATLSSTEDGVYAIPRRIEYSVRYPAMHTVQDADCSKDLVCSRCGVTVHKGGGHVMGEIESDGNNHWYSCVFCGEQFNKAAHEFDAGTILVKPTCTEDGRGEGVCSVCGYSGKYVIPCLGHDPGEEYYNGNKHWRICERCGEGIAFTGDLSGNGEIEAKDYLILKKYILTNSPQLTEKQLVAADINEDGTLDARDYIYLKRVILGTAVLK